MMLSLFIVIPMSLLLLVFVSVYAGVGAGLIAMAAILNVKSWTERQPWRHHFGSLAGGVILGIFGWVILKGSWVTGADIINGLITRLGG